MEKIDDILHEYLILKIEKIDKTQKREVLESMSLKKIINLWKSLSTNEN